AAPMPTRNADARWEGDLEHGKGRVRLGSGLFEGSYSVGSRFKDEPDTNPEELLGAAHAACYSMALSAALSRSGNPPTSVETTAQVHLDSADGGFVISRIELRTRGKVDGIDAATFARFAEDAKSTCPLSKALAATPIELDAQLTS
ncbi:MAG: OsmC family protein, partial [Acidimicrobiales bacterium]